MQRTGIATLAALVAGTALAQAESAEERAACMGDAFAYCMSAIPSHARVEACLIRNRNVISAGCRRFLPAAAPAKKIEAQPRKAAVRPAPEALPAAGADLPATR